MPILRANCVACHNKGKSEGELNLESSQSIMKGGSSGKLVVPGKPEDSYLYHVVARIEESFMPPWPNEVQAKKLTPKQLGILKQWISEGAKAGSSTTAATMEWQTINSGLQAIYAVDTDPYGRFVAAGRAGSVAVYDLQAKDNVTRLLDPALAAAGSPSQTAHRDYVHAIAFHPNGQLLATAGFQVVKLWERDVASLLVPANKQNPVRVVTSSDGTVSAIHRSDKSVVTRNGDVVTPRAKDIDPATSQLLAIGGPANNQLVTALADGVIAVSNVTDMAEIARSEVSAGKFVAGSITADGSKVVALSEDGTLRLLTLDAAKKTLSAADPIKSAEGAIKQLIAAENTLLCRIEGNTVELRNIDTLKVTRTIQTGSPNVSAAISPNAERVVTVAADGKVELWNTKDGKVIKPLTADLATARVLATRTADKAARDARVKVVKGQVTEDEKRVTEQKESLKKAEEELKKATDAVATAKKKAKEEAPKVAAAQKASDEKAEDANLKKKLEAAQKAEQTAKDAVTTAENSLKSAQKGKELTQQAIKRAEARVAERQVAVKAVEAEAKVSADAHAAAATAAKATVASQHAVFVNSDLVATIDQNNIRLWNASDGTALDLLAAALPSNPVSARSAGNDLVVEVQENELAIVSVFPKWKLKQILGPQGNGKPSAFVDRVLSLEFSPDGTKLAAGGGEASRSGELTLWNVSDGKLIRRFDEAHSDTVYGVDFSADGKLLASAAADKFVKVFNLATGKHVRSYEGHTHHVMDVSWKGDGTKLASAGADNAIKVWDAETGEQSRTISTYKKQVTSLSFIGMEDEFISCSGDKRVFRHRAANGGTVREFKGCPDFVYCSATTADGMVVAAGCEDGILRIWNGKDGKEIAQFAPIGD